MSIFRSLWTWIVARFFRRLADAHRHLGNTYGDQEQHWVAVENYTRAMVYDPDYAEAIYSRGVLYWRELGNMPRAIQDLTRALELEPGRTIAYFNRGIAYKLHDQLHQAVDDFERYLALGTDPFWLDSAQRQLDELRERVDSRPGVNKVIS